MAGELLSPTEFLRRKMQQPAEPKRELLSPTEFIQQKAVPEQAVPTGPAEAFDIERQRIEEQVFPAVGLEGAPAAKEMMERIRRQTLGQKYVIPAQETKRGMERFGETIREVFGQVRHPAYQRQILKEFRERPMVGMTPPSVPPEKAVTIYSYKGKPIVERAGKRTEVLSEPAKQALFRREPEWWTVKGVEEIKERPSEKELLMALPRAREGPVDRAGRVLSQFMLGGMSLIDTPFRVLGGLAKGAQDSLDYWIGSGEEPPDNMFMRALKSGVGIDPVYITDVFETAAQTYKGSPLTKGERTAARLTGLGMEFIVGGRLFPRWGGGPAAPQIGKQVGRALKGAGAKVKPKAFEQLGEVIVGKERVIPHPTIPGRKLVEASDLPARIAEARRFVRRLAPKYGLDPAKADEVFRQIIGPHGVQFGAKGLTTVGGKELIPRGKYAPSQVKEITAGARPLVPYGAGYGGWLPPGGLREAAAGIQWGAGAAPAGVEQLRPAQAYMTKRLYEAEKARRDLERMARRKWTDWFSGKESERVTKVLEYEYAKTALPRETQPLLNQIEELHRMRAMAPNQAAERAITKKITELNDLVIAKHEGAIKIVNNLELTERELELGIKALHPKQQDLARKVRAGFDDMFNIEVAEGIPVNYLGDMISRFETLPSRKAHFREFGPGRIQGKPSFTKHRLGLEAGVGIGGTSTRQFFKRIGDIYAQRMKAHAVAVSAAKAENQILRTMGREMEGVPERIRLEQRGVQEGYAIYTARAGHYAGKKFLLDKGTAELLDRMTNPSQLDKFIRSFDKVSAYWKSRATVFRPGFSVRNIFFGNVWQLYLADVPITPGTITQAARVMSRRFGRSPVGGQARHRAFLRNLMGAKKGSKKIGQYTIDEWVDIAEQNKVFGTGFYGSEMESIGRAGVGGVLRRVGRGLNPLGRHNILMRGVASFNRMGEDLARLMLFMDKVKKGYSFAEASQRVARYIFNYDELSRVMKGMRQVVPFWTWNYKNWGLEATKLLSKPDKFGKFWRGYIEAQELDPMTEQDAILDLMAGKERVRQLWFRVPFIRGREEAGRMYVPLAGLWPGASLQQLDPEIAWSEFVQMVHPLWRYLSEAKERAEEERPPRVSYFAQPPRFHDEGTVRAPDFITGLMSRAKQLGIHDALTDLFQPKYDQAAYQQRLAEARARGMNMEEAYQYADENTTIEHYRWDLSVEEHIRTFDPGLAKIMSLARARGEEQAYDRTIGYIFGVKPFEWTVRRASREYGWAQREFINRMKAIHEKKERQTGRRIKPGTYDIYR